MTAVVSDPSAVVALTFVRRSLPRGSILVVREPAVLREAMVAREPVVPCEAAYGSFHVDLPVLLLCLPVGDGALIAECNQKALMAR